jgi:hypothetical protein
MASIGGVIACVLASGCADPEPAPDWRHQGEWIDIEGFGRTPDETCKGTFDYLDRYAKAISVEFGADEPLGIYHWYSKARWDAERPCGSEDDGNPVGGCTTSDGAFSSGIPVEHELVHMANNIVGAHCPSVLEEGLATYYTWSGKTPSKEEFELLAERFDAPWEQPLPGAEYPIAGRFAGFLVRHFGIDAVLEVCRMTGSRPSAEAFESAMISVLGTSPDELLAEMAVYEPKCDQWWSRGYRSRALACGEAGAVRRAGVVDDELSLQYRMGCDEESTADPWVGKISIIEQIEFLHSGVYWVDISDADGNAPPIELELAPCDPCGRVETFVAGDAFDQLEQIEALTYWLELRADKDFSGEFTLHFTWDFASQCTPVPNEPCDETSDEGGGD